MLLGLQRIIFLFQNSCFQNFLLLWKEINEGCRHEVLGVVHLLQKNNTVFLLGFSQVLNVLS